MMNDHKIYYSINLIKRAEKIAVRMNKKGFWLAFSGGKDSQVLYHLAKMAGVKFEAHYSLTTLDPPELVRFIRKNYPDVIIDRPELSFIQLIKKNLILPTPNRRFCCAKIKESKGVGWMTLTGVRRDESVMRSKRQEVEKWGKPNCGVPFDTFDIENETTFGCFNGKDKIVLSPILYWTNSDVWNFIRENGIEYCKLYDEGYHRMGCLFCPMGSLSAARRDEARYPKYKYAIIRAIDYILKNGGYSDIAGYNPTPEELFECWIRKEPYEKTIFELRNQKKLF